MPPTLLVAILAQQYQNVKIIFQRVVLTAHHEYTAYRVREETANMEVGVIKKKLIAREWLNFKRLSVRKLAELIPDGEPGYRTIDEFIRRGGGTLTTAAGVAEALGVTLNDLYIDESIEPKAYIESHQGNEASTHMNKQKTTAPKGSNREMDSAVRGLRAFANIDDGPAGTAASEFANALLISRFTFSGNYESLCYEILRARSTEINQLDKDQIANFIDLCRENDDDETVESLVMKFTDSRYDMSLSIFTQFATKLGYVGFSEHSREMLVWGKKHFSETI